MIYLNAAGTSWPKPDCVLAAAQPLPPDQWPRAFDEAHAAVARAFGVPTATLLPTPGCTSAIAAGLATFDLQPGDRVVTTGMEHDAVSRPLAALARRGVLVHVVPRAPDGPLDLDAYARAVVGAQLVVASVFANVTGERLPVEPVVSLAHTAGAGVLLDGAQAAGWVPLDLLAMNVEAFAFAGHKGPQAPTGVGGLYVREGLLRPGYCDTGSVDLLALRGLAAGLRWMAREDRHARARRVESVFRNRLASHVRLFPNPLDGAPTTAFLPTQVSPGDLARACRANGVLLSGGHQCAQVTHETLGTWPSGVCRASFGPLTTVEQAEQAADQVLRAL